MSEASLLSTTLKSSVYELEQAGYCSIFDICAHSQAQFIKSVSSIAHSEATAIYREARQRAQQLKQFYRAWQLRQEPVIASLKKLSTVPHSSLNEALSRNISGDGDFSDLMERSSEYVEAASIQSLFSPGRYASCLYAIASNLHDASSDLALDNRRPDLKDLVLSDANMLGEVSSLDILLDVLKSELPNYTFDNLTGQGTGGYYTEVRGTKEVLVCTYIGNGKCEVTANLEKNRLTLTRVNLGGAWFAFLADEDGDNYSVNVIDCDTEVVNIGYKPNQIVMVVYIDSHNNNTCSIVSFTVKTSSPIYHLSESYFPMNLPYDDALTSVDLALVAQNRTFTSLYQTLADTQTASFHGYPASRYYSNLRHSGKRDESQEFFLKTEEEMIYVCDFSQSGDFVDSYLVVGDPNVADTMVVPLKMVFEAGLSYLGVSGAPTSSNSISLENCFMRNGNREENGGIGYFSCMSNPSGSGLDPSQHLSVELLFLTAYTAILKTSKGYVGKKYETSNERYYLIVDATRDQALVFSLQQDDTGNNPINPDEVLPKLEVNTDPAPLARNMLALTVNSYALMLNESPTATDIEDHYGLSLGVVPQSKDQESIVTQLSDISTYCTKTGLSFNELLELTAQLYRTGVAGRTGKYRRFGMTDDQYLNVYDYGAVFLGGSTFVDGNTESTPMVVFEDEVNGDYLRFHDNKPLEQLSAAEKLVRLRQTTGLSFEMLDWVISNANVAIGYKAQLGGESHSILDSNVLNTLSACVDFQQRYGIDANTFVSFIGAVNPYALIQETSFYEKVFTSNDGSAFLPVSDVLIQDNLDLLCKAVSVTEEELIRILGYCGLTPSDSWDFAHTSGPIYRFGAIPRMLGVSFSEAEALWKLMGDSSNNLLIQLGCETGLYALDIIYQTEQVLAWLNDNELSLLQLQAMLNSEFSTTATAEMYTFLQNVYNSMNTQETTLDASLEQRLLRVMAGGFHQKTNLMKPETDWLAATSDFSLEAYWHEIVTFFTSGNVTVDGLQENSTLVKWNYQLSQRVLIARWLNLNEQDLILLCKNSAELDSHFLATPEPELSLLLLLTRLKTWQSQVTSSVDEALRLLPYLNDASTTADSAAEKIAVLHGMNSTTVKSMNDQIFGVDVWPNCFSELWKLLTWLRTGQVLNVGTSTINNLYLMMQNNVQAEDANLIDRTAKNVTAGLSRTDV